MLRLTLQDVIGAGRIRGRMTLAAAAVAGLCAAGFAAAPPATAAAHATPATHATHAAPATPAALPP
ncbi:MAG: hypothetical protein JO242_03785, partial [Streptosporangiaceae bacterium]|nr:hypothetical protein [Streptosporangiaceae bacterium]